MADRADVHELVGAGTVRELLRRLELDVTHRLDGMLHGDYRGLVPGHGSEPGETRRYEPGDDIRRIDWNLYGRLERHYVKLFEEEEDLRLYVLLDCSASMDYGSPNKFDYARRLAAGLAYIVLSNMESVAVSVFSSEYEVIQTPSRGKGKIHPILRRLNMLEAGGGSSLKGAAARFAAHTRKSGMVVVISDFLTDEGIETVAPLLGSGHQIELMQVLSPEEANPQLTGDLQLVDRETGERMDVSMGVNVLKRYHERLSALQAELKKFALRSGGDFFPCVTSTPVTELIMGAMRSGKLIR